LGCVEEGKLEKGLVAEQDKTCKSGSGLVTTFLVGARFVRALKGTKKGA
jgi:hypothetical protein